MNYVYHGSHIPNLKTIKKNISTHKKEWVYATPSKALATIFLSQKGGDLYYSLSGNGIDEPIRLVERKPGMFEDIFNCNGYIYKLDSKNFKSGLTNWSGEVVSDKEEEIISSEYIKNAYEELLKLNKENKIELYLYPNRPKFIPLDNSDLIPKVIDWKNKGFNISKFYELYPELVEKMEEQNIKRLNKSTEIVMQIINNKILKLPYFDDKNMHNNKQTLKKVLVEGKLLADGQLAIYITKTNTIYIEQQKLDSITDEKLVELLLHEFLHFLSADIKELKTGFQDINLPITYNEALTQWLTLKMLYENDLENAIMNNNIYPQSVMIVNELIKQNGEMTIFKGYFENNIQKSLSQMTKESKIKWIDIILKLYEINEEKISKERMNEFEQRINNQGTKI